MAPEELPASSSFGFPWLWQKIGALLRGQSSQVQGSATSHHSHSSSWGGWPEILRDE